MLSLALLCLSFLTQAQESNQKGSFYGHIRSFGMSTINMGSLSDHYAITQGAGLGYQSPLFHRFRLEVNGFFIFKLASSPLQEKDPSTQKLSRYELGLLDLTNPRNGKDLDRLEEVYLSYVGDLLQLRFGRQVFESSFVNPQDSRMRPGLFEGLSAQWGIEQTQLKMAWFWASSPRSTVEWYPIQNAIGVYGLGRNNNGQPGNYYHHTHSKGLGIFVLQHKFPVAELLINNTVLENISNSSQVMLSIPLKCDFTFKLQLIKQWRLGTGGNKIENLKYQQSKQSQVWSTRVERLGKNLNWQVNASFINKGGKFLFPREFGTEPFFTHLSRERNEGYANLWAISTKVSRTIRPGQKVFVAVGFYNMPPSDQHQHSKYGLDDYLHLNAGIELMKVPKLPGCSLKSLFVFKKDLSQQSQEKYLINMSDMYQFNLVIDYHFSSKTPSTSLH